MSRNGQPRSLVRRLVSNLAITIGLLLGALLLSIIISIVVVNNQQSVDQKRLALESSSTSLLQTMLDQETGVRDYINSGGDTTFLEPYNTGRTQYNDALHKLQSESIDQKLDNVAMAVKLADQRANDWINQWAELQIERVKQGQLNEARDANINRDGKNRFDAFRAAVGELNQAIERDANRIERDNGLFQIAIIIILVLVGLVALFFIWRSSSQFVTMLRNQLNQLMDVTDRLEGGDLAARIIEPSDDELGRLGQNFNAMALALQQQQNILKDKDIQNSVVKINATLSSSLELELLLDLFLKELLQLLNVQIGVIYLYNKETQALRVAASQGVDHSNLVADFQMGEGMLGRAAETREPTMLQRPNFDEQESQRFALKTVLGYVVPTTILNQPLVLGNELMGVLMTGTLYPMPESARSVINIVSSGLASAISNAQAYEHIQNQAEELERRKSELERGNQQLSRQRDELTVLNTALEEANRLRNQFLSTMSHELRTPLTAIIGFSQLSLRSAEAYNLSQRHKANLDHILRNGQHLLNLVNDVLDIAKIEAGRMDITHTKVSVETMLKEIIEETQPLWLQKRLKVTYRTEPAVGTIETDPDRLRQILLNLIGNAIKFTENGGITLIAAVRIIQPNRMDDRKEMVAISVADTGVGIEPEVQQRIFEEFYQADSSTTRKYGGTGLGLSIVQKLTDLLGGQVELQSTLGAGSTFTIVLPCEARAQTGAEPRYLLLPQEPIIEPAVALVKSDPQPALIQPTEIETDKHLVLSVDDDPDVITLIRGTLEDSAYQVVGLVDPKQVFDTVQKLRPYAITLDVMMPDLNGWQILQQLKGNPATANIPIIMLTVVSDRSAGYVLGANDYLVKPVDRDILLKTLDRLAQRRTSALQASGNGIATKSENDEHTNKGLPQERAYVLVVDDDPDVRMILEDTIVEAGYQVKTAAGGHEGLQLALSERPGLILLDLMMPDLDGFEVLDRLKADPRTTSIPVVIQTAKTLTQQERERLKLGAARIIQKGSIPLQTLVEELNRLLRKNS